MSLTVVVPARSDPRGITLSCLRAAAGSLRSLRLAANFILVADHSDAQADILAKFQAFRSEHRDFPARIARSRRWLHYTGVMSTGLQLADTDTVFLLSNDMLVTPHFLIGVLGVAGAVPRAGIVRGTSDYVDTHPQYEARLPSPAASFDDVLRFGAARFEANGLGHAVDNVLSADAVLVRRALIDAIGVMDTRFFGFFGDVDYGIRARQAGFELVCATGAWLHHVGAGEMKANAERPGETLERARAARLELIRAGYRQFRDKWRVETPVEYSPTDNLGPIVAQAEGNGATPPARFRLPDAFWDDIELL